MAGGRFESWNMMRAGVAQVDITPRAGAHMAGFGARTKPATGTHDPLSVRAIALNDTAMVVADVIGLDETLSASARARCVLPSDNVIIAALHTHGGPVSMAARLGATADPEYLQRLEDACVQAIDEAVGAQHEVTLGVGTGEDPGIARNRRNTEGAVDGTLPVLRIRDKSGKVIAVMLAYACHPVVLGADNRCWTADYPHFVRAALERAYPDAMALFITGCAGDANHGHTAHASLSLASDPRRSFATAREIGEHIAHQAIQAPERTLSRNVSVQNQFVNLQFCRRETDPPQVLEKSWIKERSAAEPGRQVILDHWIKWAKEIAPHPANPLKARVTVLNWGGIPIIGFPGEIFAQTALDVRAALGNFPPAFIAGYAEDNPGYIPPASEFSSGGYEVDEAHRYYGLPESFASGSAELLATTAIGLCKKTKFTSSDGAN